MYSHLKNENIKIINIGPSFSEKGGIVSVIDSLKRQEEFSKNIFYLETFTKKAIFQNFFVLIFFFLYLYLNRQIKIIHIHTSKKGSFFRKSMFVIVSKLYKRKVIIHIHSGEFHKFATKNNVTERYIQYIFSLADKIIYLSNKMEYNMNKIVKDNFYKTVIIPNGVLDTYNNETIFTCKKNILFMGKIIEEKGIYDFIDALDDVKLSENEQVIIAGDADKKNYSRLINKISISRQKDKINYIGWINEDEKLKILTQTKILVVPSYFEGHPITVLEGMSNKIPIISTDIPEIVECLPKDYPYLFPPKNSSKLAEKLNELKIDDIECNRMGEKLYRLFKEKYTLAVQIKNIQKVYRELIETGEFNEKKR